MLVVNTGGVVSLSPPAALHEEQAASAYSPHCFVSPASPCACAYPRLFKFSFLSEVKETQIWAADITCAELALWSGTALSVRSFCKLCTGMRHLLSCEETEDLGPVRIRASLYDVEAPLSWCMCCDKISSSRLICQIANRLNKNEKSTCLH